MKARWTFGIMLVIACSASHIVGENPAVQQTFDSPDAGTPIDPLTPIDSGPDIGSTVDAGQPARDGGLVLGGTLKGLTPCTTVQDCDAGQSCLDLPGELCTPTNGNPCRSFCWKPTPCGGIAGLDCPTGQVCVDRADDVCNPGNGVDCLGQCVPMAATLCGQSGGACVPGVVICSGTTLPSSNGNDVCGVPITRMTCCQ